MQKLSSLSIFFPAYNDQYTILPLIKKSNEIAQKVSKRYEIIVINDASPDNTQQVLEQAARLFKKLRIIRHKKNKGYGGALASGFKTARYRWVFYTDGDGQYDPNELPKLISLADSADVINGYKLKREDPLLRTIIGWVYNKTLHVLYSLPISDVDCDYRLIRRSKLNGIRLTSKSGTICLELVLKLKKNGARFKEVGVHHYARKYGKSQFFKLSNVVKTIRENYDFFLKFRLKNP